MKFNKEKYKVLHPRQNNPIHNWYRLGSNWLSYSPAEKNVEVGVDTELRVDSMLLLQIRQTTYCIALGEG